MRRGRFERFGSFPHKDLEQLSSLLVYVSRGGPMRTLLCFLIAAALAVAADVDVTGKWTGNFNLTNPDGETNESTAVLKLKQSGTEITGTVGPNEDEQAAIQKGKIEGNKITMEAEHHGRV